MPHQCIARSRGIGPPRRTRRPRAARQHYQYSGAAPTGSGRTGVPLRPPCPRPPGPAPPPARLRGPCRAAPPLAASPGGEAGGGRSSPAADQQWRPWRAGGRSQVRSGRSQVQVAAGGSCEGRYSNLKEGGAGPDIGDIIEVQALMARVPGAR